MNSEDKILSLLQDLSGRVSSLKDGQIEIRLHLENVTDRNIQLLLEQYIPNTNKLNDTREEVDKIKFDVGNIKRVVASHSKEINELLKR